MLFRMESIEKHKSILADLKKDGISVKRQKKSFEIPENYAILSQNIT